MLAIKILGGPAIYMLIQKGLLGYFHVSRSRLMAAWNVNQVSSELLQTKDFARSRETIVPAVDIH